MVFDEETGTVVDPTVEQSMKFLDEETLPGFTLDLSLLTQSKSAETRPQMNTGFPSAQDSVSTLGVRKDYRSKSNTAMAITTAPTPEPSRADDQSIHSTTSAITIETINTIETQLQTLQQQVASTDSKFLEIMEMLRQGNGNLSQRTESQAGTSRNPVTLDAGEDSPSSSGGVP